MPHDPAPIAPHECWLCRAMVTEYDANDPSLLWGTVIGLLIEGDGDPTAAIEFIDTTLATPHQSHKRSWV